MSIMSAGQTRCRYARTQIRLNTYIDIIYIKTDSRASFFTFLPLVPFELELSFSAAVFAGGFNSIQQFHRNAHGHEPTVRYVHTGIFWKEGLAYDGDTQLLFIRSLEN